jgi:Fe-S cluster assembly protein SufD
MRNTLPHEHILVDFIGAEEINPPRWDREEVILKVLPYLEEARSAGCHTLIDCTPNYLGRDVGLLKILSEKTGLFILTNTGYYGGSDNKFLPAHAFTESADQLARRWIAEWLNGIDGTPIRPGFMKISVNPSHLSDVSLKLVQAAALTHLKTGLTIASHTSLGSGHIALAGTHQQKESYLVPLAKGEKLAGWCLTEPGSGSDASGLNTTARKVGDKWILNGTKIFITQGSVGDTYVVLAKTDPEKGTKGISGFIVEREWKGVQPGEPMHMLGMNSSDTTEVVFDNVDVPEENHIYFDPGDGCLMTFFVREDRDTDPKPVPDAIGIAIERDDGTLKRLRGILEGDASSDHLNWEVELPEGVTKSTITAEEARDLGELAPNDRPSALAVANAGGAVLIDVAAEAEVDEPVVIRLHGDSVDQLVWGHLVLRVRNHAKVTVVLVHTGSARYAATTSVLVEDGATANVLTLQDWDDDAVHLGRDAIRVGRDASVRHTAISFGGDLVRMHANVEYAGPGGEAELYGLYFADEGQHIEHRLFADHTAPQTKSNVVYKGALQGQGAHTVWIGNVLIRKVAEGIETYEENRNLVLTDGCQADSVPNLEIETGEIEGAGHASATARFDDEQLFYLRSRGVSEKEAQRLVVHGFFNDLIRKIGVPAIEEKLLATVEAELAKNVLKEID